MQYHRNPKLSIRGTDQILMIFSRISELNKEFPAICLVERFLIFNNYPAKSPEYRLILSRRGRRSRGEEQNGEEGEMAQKKLGGGRNRRKK